MERWTNFTLSRDLCKTLKNKLGTIDVIVLGDWNIQCLDQKGAVSEEWGEKREPEGAKDVNVQNAGVHFGFLDKWGAEDWIAHFATKVENTRILVTESVVQKSRIDHIYVSCPKLYENGGVSDCLGSDHHLVRICMNEGNRSKSKSRVRKSPKWNLARLRGPESEVNAFELSKELENLYKDLISDRQN